MLSIILILFTALFFTGIILRTKSIASGRKGPGIMQPVKDVIRLFRKGAVYSETTSIIFRIAPVIYFSSVFMACLVVPFGSYKGVVSFDGDFIFFAYILALGKFFSIISAMDTGSSFEGMGASREALYSMFAEPAFFILIGSFALLTGNTSFHDMFSTLHLGSSITYMLGVMAAFVLVMIAMIENSRMPVDDPKTHLELTMIHEVMILDNSGFDLGLILTTGYLKFAMYGAIIADLFLGGLALMWTLPLFLMIQFMFAVLIGLIESFMARFRMSHNPQFILALSSVSFLIFLGVLLVLEKFV
jgi:formate hydrogenlyase subunit 4